MPLRIELEDMEHPHPTTTITTDNYTGHGLISGSMTPKAYKSMEMWFNWIKCRDVRRMFEIQWRRGAENKADFPSKQHAGLYHLQVRYQYAVDAPLGQ